RQRRGGAAPPAVDDLNDVVVVLFPERSRDHELESFPLAGSCANPGTRVTRPRVSPRPIFRKWREPLASGMRKIMSIRIAPSILSADLGRLADEVREAEAAGADWIHVDAMDGQFVPNMTVGPVVLEAVRRATTLPLDVHLMLLDPDRHLEAFAEAGADILSIQLEATRHPQRTLARIRALGKRAGLVLNPHTPEEAVRYLLPDVDVLLVMTVNPGFAGQQVLPQVLPKVRVLREWLDREGLPAELEVDGGIHPGTARDVVAAGASVLVAGTAVFGQRDRRHAIAALRTAAAAP